VPDFVMTGDFDTVRFPWRGVRKDLGLATSLAREYEVPLPLASIAEQDLIHGLARGWGERDFCAPWLLQEERASVQVRKTR
jgi:3-hydroxyisobutyrate dehydrogenase-like beta-hydroxyacid dehydrogenase